MSHDAPQTKCVGAPVFSIDRRLHCICLSSKHLTIFPLGIYTGKSQENVRVGHGGTLDMAAEGVLVLGIGREGCRALGAVLQHDKRYAVEVQLGTSTDTHEHDGKVTLRRAYDHVTQRILESTLKNFTGTLNQVPPLYSAIKVCHTLIRMRRMVTLRDMHLHSISSKLLKHWLPSRSRADDYLK